MKQLSYLLAAIVATACAEPRETIDLYEKQAVEACSRAYGWKGGQGSLLAQNVDPHQGFATFTDDPNKLFVTLLHPVGSDRMLCYVDKNTFEVLEKN